MTPGGDSPACDRGEDEPESVSALQSPLCGRWDSGWNRWVKPLGITEKGNTNEEIWKPRWWFHTCPLEICLLFYYVSTNWLCGEERTYSTCGVEWTANQLSETDRKPFSLCKCVFLTDCTLDFQTVCPLFICSGRTDKQTPTSCVIFFCILWFLQGTIQHSTDESGAAAVTELGHSFHHPVGRCVGLQGK